MKKAFVTGATGFLGVNLVHALLEAGWSVTVLVLPDDILTYLRTEEITYVKGNILDKKSLEKVMIGGPDVTVFHVAGMTSMWHKQNAIQYEVNVVGTKNVCEVALDKGVGKLVYTSSISAFGYHDFRINEETKSNAMVCKMNYNKTKFLAENEVKSLITKGLNAVIVNPCNIIGPYDTVGWSTLITSAHKGDLKGATNGIGTFAHVKDVVNGHILAAEKGKIGENYLLGGVEISFSILIALICKKFNKSEPKKSISNFVLKLVMYLQYLKSLKTKEMPLITYPRYKRLSGCIICDDSKAIKELGYKHSTIDQMISDSYNWLVKEGVL